MISPGLRFQKYEVKRQLGQGGFGVVFVARDHGLERDCALKFLLPEHTTRPELLQRFLSEARAAAHIDHGGIITVFECGIVAGVGPGVDGTAFIAMELLRGESLAARLQRGRLSVELAVEITRQVASALMAAHAAGVIHRDLKPDNIFLVPDAATVLGERAKVLDFGIAKLAEGRDSSDVRTGTHMIFGTPKYMSPEQCKSTARVDARSDIYALGCILFEMVTGQTPFEGDFGELVAMHQLGTPPRASTLRADLPAALDETIAVMLAKQPTDRPSTMTDVIARLGSRPSSLAMAVAVPSAAVAPTVPPDATTYPPMTPSAGPAPQQAQPVLPATSASRPQRNWSKWLLLGIAAIAAAIAIVVVTRPDRLSHEARNTPAPADALIESAEIHPIDAATSSIKPPKIVPTNYLDRAIVTRSFSLGFLPNSTKLQTDRATLRQLREITNLVTSSHDAPIHIAGFSDSSMKGTADENMVRELSAARAAAVKQFLVDVEHVDPARIETEGFGWSRPADPADPDNHAKNRRIEVRVLPPPARP